MVRALLVATVLVPWLAGAGEPAPMDREQLKRALNEVLSRPALQSSRVGVLVQSLRDGSTLYAHNADELLNPASNIKLVTAAATLARLGPEFRFQTEFLTDADLGASGKTRTLYVRGKGDPTLTTERLYGIVAELVHVGLREVGDIVLDDSWFDGTLYPPGYEQEEGDRAYLAPTGALSLNWNTIGVYLRPGDKPGARAVVELEPKSDFFQVENQLTTGKRQQHRWSVKSEPSGERQRIVVRGNVGLPDVARRRIDNPTLYFGHTLKALLAERGVKVKGKVKRGTVGTSARLLHVSLSDTFDVVLKVMNKNSQNMVAEQLLKALGAEVKGAPGSTAKGVEVVEEFLANEVHIPRGSYVLKNGSGLNDTNRMSATQLAKLLAYMKRRFTYADEFVSSVPIAGKDGTLRNRFEGSEAEARIRAKTGTLENVTALSGYVQTAGGEEFSFAFLINDFDWRRGGRKAVVGGMEAMGVAVAAGGAPQGVARGQDGGPLEDAMARIRTYLSLGQQRDVRNIPFLRTAWRNEKEPAVRAVLADALYQSNPSDFLGVQSFLESYSPEPVVFGRLRQVARELSVQVPGVGSVVELAARGNADALKLLLTLAYAAEGDVSTQAELAASLADVARTAPDELLHSLRALKDVERDTVTTLLARGLVAAQEADHPFWATLKRAFGHTDREVATFARATEGVLSAKVAREKSPVPTSVVPVLQPIVPTLSGVAGGGGIESSTRPGG
ncbi:MAG: D-alanyl-D-alanine carboxypeptidase/D-alanyl-D-alanine-endopeptidase [Myxococcaceae bacterium]|nr:D-alanyl-D-alanine carboxypeptidase/D-alanyl-D-alanine-endopeptidase [Myxococcaceae bacterium]MCI0671141.1 D-alanyl-D-alanine carboxypeptidase/D-alanyl-D-alanine-endopeptidase [Myxococcaceae bacterium]